MSKYSHLDSKENQSWNEAVDFKSYPINTVRVGHIFLDYRISEVHINSSDPIITIYSQLSDFYHNVNKPSN